MGGGKSFRQRFRFPPLERKFSIVGNLFGSSEIMCDDLTVEQKKAGSYLAVQNIVRTFANKKGELE